MNVFVLCLFNCWRHAVQQLSESVVTIKLRHWVLKSSAPGQSGGRACPHAPPEAAEAAGRWKPRSASPLAQALLSVPPCVSYKVNCLNSQGWIFNLYALCCFRANIKWHFPRMRFDSFPKNFQRSGPICHSICHLLVVSLWVRASLRYWCYFFCFLLLNMTCSEKLNPETILVLPRNRNSNFGQLLIRDLNSKQKILPNYDQEVPSSNSL